MLIEVAEESGNLPGMIGLLSKWHEVSHRMIRKIQSGLMLPATVLLIAAFVYPAPRFVLGGWNVNQYLRDAASILAVFIVPAVVIVMIVRHTPKTGPLRRVLDRLVLRIPILSRAVYRLALSQYCWAFHMLCRAGVPITDCVQMAIRATSNVVVGDLFRPAADAVRAGGNMGDGLSRRLPVELVEMWKVGEETGQLDEVSKRLAHNYAEQAEFWFGEFSRWFPRFVYLLICIMLIWMILNLAPGVYGGAISF